MQRFITLNSSHLNLDNELTVHALQVCKQSAEVHEWRNGDGNDKKEQKEGHFAFPGDY